MSGRGWMFGVGLLVLGAFAIFLLRETRREPDRAPPSPSPVLEAPPSPPVGASPVVNAPPRPAPPPMVSMPPGAPPSLPPRSEIPERPAAPPPPSPSFVRQQKMRGLSMLSGEIRALEREQDTAKQAGDNARADSIGVRLERLRGRKTQLDEELRGSVEQ